MKRIGLSLIAAAFLAGAWLAVLHPTEVSWAWFVPAVALGFVGVALARMADRSTATHSETVRSNVDQLESSIATIIDEVARLDADKADTHVYAFPGLIDERIVPHLNRFVEVRDTMKTAYGLPLFARVMGPFAGGERYLNRVWSASADGYVDEAHDYIDRALVQFREAQAALLAARAQGA